MWIECGGHYKNGEYNNEYYIAESSLLKGIGCPVCCQNPQIVVENINSIPTTAPWMIPYFQEGYDEAQKYTKCSGDYIYPICPDCGRIKNDKVKICSIHKNNSIGCYCSDGKPYGEKLMFTVLEKLNIDFETEYSPNWCKYEFKNKIRQGRYDFYILSMNLIIEMDGGWHKEYNNQSGQTKEESQYIDNKKDVLAREHDIKLLEWTVIIGRMTS